LRLFGASASLDALASDNCGSVTLVNDYNGTATLAGETFPVGTHTITWTATDECELSSTCSFTITVVDNENPVITCPDDIEVENDPGECSAVVNYEVTATDNCPPACPTADFAGYDYLGSLDGHSYFISTSATNWAAAKTAAEALGGHLATISSAAEQAVVISGGTDFAWIGFTDEAVEGTFAWVTGEPVTYTAR
jgi:hypothetical protein